MSKFIYPVDTDQFQQIREDGKVYVDKTGLINKLVNEEKYKYVFLARPRRFGKSLLCNTLKAYFQGQKELFVDTNDLERNASILVMARSLKMGDILFRSSQHHSLAIC